MAHLITFTQKKRSYPSRVRVVPLCIVIIIMKTVKLTVQIFSIPVEDSERHDGSPEKPYYMSKPLKKLLGKKNKKASDSD